MLHHIQRQIILKLAHGDQFKYSQIKPEELENDLFNYHLQYLVKNGLVEKLVDGYKLSVQGLDKLFMMDSQGNEYQGLRVSVLVYIIKEYNGQKFVLAQKRHRDPYREEDNPGIAGKVLKGELIEVAAERKVKEETGLNGKCRFVGVLRKIRQHSDGIIDDGLFHVCVCIEPTGEVIEQNEFGENHWVNFTQAIALQKELKGMGQESMRVLKNILAGTFEPFYLQEVTKIEKI